jgi:hypothetical protein
LELSYYVLNLMQKDIKHVINMENKVTKNTEKSVD